MSTQATDTELKELLEKFSRNSIVLNISEEVPITKGWTRFGGQPDVPPGGCQKFRVSWDNTCP